MTLGILKANALRIPIEVVLKDGHHELGYFYEHKTYTSGMVYHDTDLKKVIRQHNQDPVTLESNGIDNWADWFAANISDNKVVVVPVAHTFNLSGDAGLNKEIITTNYNRYRVFRK